MTTRALRKEAITLRVNGDSQGDTDMANLPGARLVSVNELGDGDRLADPDITEIARKVLLTQLDEVARELDAAQRQRPLSPHVEEDLRAYREMAKKPETFALMTVTWEDEPLAWRRSWVRRFIEGVDVVKLGRSIYQVTVHYMDGHVSELSLNTKGEATPEELALVAKLWTHPKRPERRWAAWIIGRLEAHGYKRTLRGVYRLVALARAGATVPR